MYFFCDVETTGKCPLKNDIITICIIVADNDLNKVDYYYDEIKPENPQTWGVEAEEVHGISLEKALTFKEPSIARRDLLRFLKKYQGPNIFVCHNRYTKEKKKFDYHFIEEFMGEVDVYEFYKSARPQRCRDTHLPSKVSPLDKQSLSDWAQYLGIALNHHEAQSDTNACYEIYKWQFANLENFTIMEKMYHDKYIQSFIE